MPVDAHATHLGFKGLKYKRVRTKKKTKWLYESVCTKQVWEKEISSFCARDPLSALCRLEKTSEEETTHCPQPDGKTYFSYRWEIGDNVTGIVIKDRRRIRTKKVTIKKGKVSYVPFGIREDIQLRSWDEHVPQRYLDTEQRICTNQALSAFYSAARTEEGRSVLDEIMRLSRIRVKIQDNRMAQKPDSKLKYGPELNCQSAGKCTLTLHVARNSDRECLAGSAEQLSAALRKWAFRVNGVAAESIYRAPPPRIAASSEETTGQSARE